MASLPNIMLEGSQCFSGKKYNTWKQFMLMIFEYRCLDKIILDIDTWPTLLGKDQDKFDDRDWEAAMLIKLSVTDEMLLEVQTSTNSTEVWKHLWDLHEMSCKSRAFLKNMFFLIMMNETSLQEHLLKIKDIRD